MSDTTFDYIIIGGGTAGALLANRLSNDRKLRVLLVEAGRKDDFHWIHLPVGVQYCAGNPRTDWCLHTAPTPGLNDRKLPFPRGKTLGGSSSLNHMLYVRGAAHDYDRWADLVGDDCWRWDQALPDFQRHEQHWRLDTHKNGQPLHPDSDAARQHHGHKGEWRVDRQRAQWGIVEAFRQAALQAGLPANDDFNTGQVDGVGYFDVHQKDGLRWNAAKAFLRPRCYARANFELWTMAQATQLVTERQPDGSLRCTGVKVWDGVEMVHLTATEEVLLCAGAIHTPQLLQLSGIGPAQLLHTHGVPLALDAPGVGANLQDLLQLPSVYQVQGAPTLNTLAGSAVARARMGLQFALRRSGPVSAVATPLGLFAKSQPHLPHANVHLQVQPLSNDGPGTPLHTTPAITVNASQLQPTSRGTVHIHSPRFEDAPTVAPNYLATEEDRQVAIDSLRLTRRIAAQAALAPYQPNAVQPNPTYETDVDLAYAAAELGRANAQPVGTTRMGAEGDPLAVLDSRLRVRGVHALRVVDAGAMPTLVGIGSTTPTLMLAEKAAAWIRADYQARHARQTAPACPPATPSDTPTAQAPAPVAAKETVAPSLSVH